MLTVFVISDGSGKTADRVLRAALAQFEGAEVHTLPRDRIRSPEQIHAIVQEAFERNALIVHTLVSNQLRTLMLDESRARGVDSFDMLGPLLDRLATHLELAPQEKPGLIEQLVSVKSRQIEAVDFSFRHDDGQNAGQLDRAEVVLVGVSRTMKTPTMLYMAYRGWYAANVPLVLNVPLPEGLLTVPSQRVFCLLMNPNRLMELRKIRARQEGIPIESYASLAQVRKELLRSQELCHEHHWRKIDTTAKSVEEVGREIISLLPDRNSETASVS